MRVGIAPSFSSLLRNLLPLAAAVLLAGCPGGGPSNPPTGCNDGGGCPAGEVCGVDGVCRPGGVVDLAGGTGCVWPCEGDTPICDKATGECVGCLADDDCPSGRVCKQRQCTAGCSANRPGCGDAGSCDVDLGLCRGCMTDQECGGATPRCNAVTGRCERCLPERDNCPDGQYCAGASGVYSCQPGCKSQVECGEGKDCCNHACVSVVADPKNCGACGKGCGAAACCNGRCSDVQSDAMNCGACGQPCNAVGANPLCIGGRCTIGSCQAGRLDCDGKFATGCEIDSTNDAMNCSACGQVCPIVANGSGGCAGSKCVVGTCKQGFFDCDGALNNGCEADSNKDPNNCGGCGKKCAGGATCNAGMCVLACTGTKRDCDGQMQNGCEVDITSDPSNCNGCGNVCNFVLNGKAVCTNGLCGASCNDGYADCDSSPVNGCESRVDADPNNCGGCGKKCVAQNGTAQCMASTCKITCNPNFGDCDNNTANGCETDLRATNAHCGACNKACGGSTPLCMQGACSGSIHNTITFPSNAATSSGCAYNNSHAIKWVNLGSMQWKVCALEASKRGAMMASTYYTVSQGWVSHRRGTNAQYYNGSWTSYAEQAITNNLACVVARDPNATTNSVQLNNVTTYDGQTWRYTNYGLKYYDECQTLASNAGAMIITPSTIGLTGDQYWITSLLPCNTYEYVSCPSTCSMSYDNLGSGARSTQRNCLVGYVDN